MKTIRCLWIAVLLLTGVFTGCAQNNRSASTEPSTQADAATESAASTTSEASVQAEDSNDPSELQFEALELDITRGTLYIRAGSAFSYTKEDGGKADYELVGNTLHISQKQDHKTVLILPEGISLTSLQLSVQEGHVYAECALTLQTLDLSVGQGEVTCSKIAVAARSTIEVNRGSASLFGDPGETVTLRSTEGHLRLDVSVPQTAFNFEISLTTGNIHLGTEDYHGPSYSKSIDNGASRSMVVTCARGELSVDFSK